MEEGEQEDEETVREKREGDVGEYGARSTEHLWRHIREAEAGEAR